MAMRRMAMKKAGMKAAMKAAMKKGMKKSMRKMKKAKKVSIIGRGRLAKSQVFKGRKTRTSGGLKKSDLKRNKNGKIVSIKKSNFAKKSKIGKWATAVVAARQSLNVKGFCAVGGKTKQGQQLLAKVRSLYRR